MEESAFRWLGIRKRNFYSYRSEHVLILEEIDENKKILKLKTVTIKTLSTDVVKTTQETSIQYDR